MKYIGLNLSRIKVLWNWAQNTKNGITKGSNQYWAM